MRCLPAWINRLTSRMLIIGIILITISAGCSKNKFSCDAYGFKKANKMKKNKSNYGALYSTKPRPVPKNYNIKNGR